MSMPRQQGNPSLLFVDHACHKRTGSFAFLHELLAQAFTVTDWYYENTYDCRLEESSPENYDVILFAEFLPDRRHICVHNVPCVFVPMFDNEWGSNWQWKRIAAAKMSVLSFCGKLSEHARACGVERLLDVRFFPDFTGFKDMGGDPRRILLWERGEIGFHTIKALFAPEAIDSVTLLRHSTKEQSVTSVITEQDIRNYHIQIVDTDYLPRKEFLEILRPAGTVLAPRLKEGIGMAYLEAMAMGKVVIAHDDATMNETIHDGENGFLFDVINPVRLDMSKVIRLHEKRIQCEKLYARWLADRRLIPEFVQSAPPCTTPRYDTYRYLRFLAEAAAMRFHEKQKHS